MSDEEDNLDLYPSNDEEFAGENLSSRHSSPYKAVSTKLSTPMDDERSEAEDEDKSSQDEEEEEDEEHLEGIFPAKIKYSNTILDMIVVPSGVENYPIIVSTGDDRKLVAWDMRSGMKLFVSKLEHSKAINSIAFHQPSGLTNPLIVTGSDDGTAIVWEVTIVPKEGASGEDVKFSVTIDKQFALTSSEVGDVSAVTVTESQGDAYIILAGEHGVAMVYNIRGAQIAKLTGHEDTIHSVAALGVHAVTASEDSFTYVWDITTGEKLLTLEGHDGAVLCVAVYQPVAEDEAPVVITGGDDGKAIVWDLFSGRQIHVLEGAHEDWIRAVSVVASLDGTFGPLVVTGSDDATLALWDLSSGEFVRKLEEGHDDYVNSIVSYVSADKSLPPVVISGSEDCTMRIWPLSRAENTPSKKVFQIQSKGLITKLQHGESVMSVQLYVPTDGLSPPLVITACNDSKIMVWDLSSGQIKFEFMDENHVDWMMAVGVYAPYDATGLPPMVIAGCYDGTALVYDLNTGKKIRDLEDEHTDFIAAIAVYVPPRGDSSPPWVVTASADRSAIVWNLKTGDVMYKLKGEHTDVLSSVAIYLPPRKTPTMPFVPVILTGSDDESVVVWDIKEEKKILTITDLTQDIGCMNAIALYAAPDGSSEPIVITGNDGGQVLLWDLATGVLLRSLKEVHTDDVLCIAVYSPSDEFSSPFFVTGARDYTAVVWDLYTGSVLRVLDGAHEGSIYGLAIYAPPAGNGLPFIVTAGDDCCAVVWNLNAEQMQSSIEGGHAGAVTAVAVYSPTHSDAQPRMLTGGEDGVMIVWELKTGKKLRVWADRQGEAISAIAVYSPRPDETASPLAVCAFKEGNSLTVVDLVLFKKLRTLNDHSAPVTSLVVHAAGALVISGSEDHTAIVWNVRSGKNLRQMSEHSNTVTAVAVHTPAKEGAQPWALTASLDNTVAICMLNSGKKISTLSKYGHETSIDTMVVLAMEREDTGSVIITGSSVDKNIVVWSTLSFSSLRKIRCGCAVNTLTVHVPQGVTSDAVVIASDTEGCLSTWSVKTGEPVRAFDASSGHSGEVRALAVYAPPSGAALVVSGGDDTAAIVWSFKTGARQQVYEGGHGEQITSMVVYASEAEGEAALLITASTDQSCIVWDINTNKKIRTLHQGEESCDLYCVAVYTPGYLEDEPIKSPLVFAAGSDGSTIHVWDLHSGESLDPIVTNIVASIHTLTLFVDSRSGAPVPMLLCGDSNGASTVFSITDRKTVKQFIDGHTAGITSATTKVRDTFIWVITGSEDATIVVRDLDSGTIVRTIHGAHSESVTSLALYVPSAEEKVNAAPILISGSEDGSAVAWDLRTGEVRRVFKGEHAGAITAVSVQDLTGTPLVVTGSNDASVVVWDMYSGRKLRKLEGNGPVSALAVCASTQSSTSSLLYVANNARVDVWADCLFEVDYMPFPATINQLLEHDLAQTSPQGHRSWSRIHLASELYGDAFWLENYSLFTKMFASKPVIRDAFFKTFKSKLHLVVHLLPRVVHKSKLKSLLEICIEDNMDIRKLMLEAWTTALNSPCNDYLNQAFHPSVFFNTEALYKLADRFPTEFIEFICHLKLVKSDPTVYLSCPSYNIERGLVIEGMPSKLSVDMWTTIGGYYCSKNAPTIGPKANQPVTAMMLPLIGAADLRMLNAYVDTSNAVGSLDIFESEVGVTAFKYAWLSFGFKIHSTTTLRYFLFIVVFTTSVFTFDRLQRSPHLSVSFWAWFQQALVLAGVLYYMVDETRQFWSQNRGRIREIKQRLLDSKERDKEKKRLKTAEDDRETKYTPAQHRRNFITGSARLSEITRSTLKQYRGVRYVLASWRLNLLDCVRSCNRALSSAYEACAAWWEDSIINLIFDHFAGFWNLVDLSVMALVVSGTLVRIANNEETDRSRCVLSVASVMVWFKVLNFMRPFKHSGPLIAMILRIMQDIQFFVFILAIVLTGFSMAFWLISYPDTSLAFGTIEMSFYNTYLYMLGQNIEADFANDTASPRLGIFLLVMFMFFMMILMLNLLIALMGNSYSKVQEKGLAEWRLGQASMILEQSYMMTERTKRSHEHYNSIHVLKYTTLVPDDDEAVSSDKRLQGLEMQISALERKLEEVLAEGKKK